MRTRPDVINRHSKAKGGLRLTWYPGTRTASFSSGVGLRYRPCSGRTFNFHARRTLNGTSVPPHLNVIDSVAATNTGLTFMSPVVRLFMSTVFSAEHAALYHVFGTTHWSIVLGA